MKILVSGLLNMETTAAVRGFPINYYPIDYPFFGISTAVSGVAFNIAKALHTLGSDVRVLSMVGKDFQASFIREELSRLEVSVENVLPLLEQTPSSVVLYDGEGKRQIYCDLKDIQERSYPFCQEQLQNVDLVVACNINFNRPLLKLAKAMGKLIATDVHVLSNINDEYNREFMEYADILFLSDEQIGEDYQHFLRSLSERYPCKMIVLGRGSQGAAMYLRETEQILSLPAASAGKVVNTVGAGDALFSSFLHFYRQGRKPEEALQLAQIFAAYKITVSGASNGFVSQETVEQFLQNNR